MGLDKLTLSSLVSLVDLINLVNNNRTNVNNSNNRTKFTKYAKNIHKSKKFRCQIPKEYVERAWKFVKPSLDYVCKLATYIDLEKSTARVRELIEKHGTIDRTKLLRNSNLSAVKFEGEIETLFQRQEIKPKAVENIVHGRKYTRMIYVWIGKDEI